MHTKEGEQTVPIEFGDHRKAGQAAKDELKQHAAATWVKIGKGRRRGCQTKEKDNEDKISKSAHVLLPSYVARFI